MTKRERFLILRAIRRIHDDDGANGGYEKGMEILCGLVGITTPMGRLVREGIRPVSIIEVASRKDEGGEGGER